MNNEVTYSSDKVKTFIENLKKYKISKNNYIDSLNKYENNINNLTDLHKLSTDKEFTSIDDNYLTAEGVIVNDTNNNNNNNTMNDINSDGKYVSNLVINKKDEDNIEKLRSNTFVQMDLNDLNYNNNVNTKDVYKFSNHEPNFTFNNNCNMKNVYQCDSYAKMTNKSFYGMSQSFSNETCKCYTFTTEEKNEKLSEYRDHIVDEEVEFTKNMKISYLALMFDKGLYVLKEENFKNNFDNLYVKNNNNTIKMNNIDPISDCNPFTGNGVSDLNIKDLGFFRCEMK